MITFQVTKTRKGKHIAAVIENGQVMAVSKKAHTNGEEAIEDVKQVLEHLRLALGRKPQVQVKQENSHAHPTH